MRKRRVPARISTFPSTSLIVFGALPTEDIDDGETLPRFQFEFQPFFCPLAFDVRHLFDESARTIRCIRVEYEREIASVLVLKVTNESLARLLDQFTSNNLPGQYIVGVLSGFLDVC